MSDELLNDERATTGTNSWGWKLPKLFFVLGCYSILFYTLVIQAYWFMCNWTEVSTAQSLTDWISCLPDDCHPSGKEVVVTLAINIGIFSVFMFQHTLLAERNLKDTYIHQKIFLEWQINGALYSLLTAGALNFVMLYWRTVPIYVWNLPSIQPIIKVVHFAAWLILYGTTLMQDMPELIGLNQQAVFNNDATSKKSEEFRRMLSLQRHLGFVPFFAIIITCQIMTLDRLVFLSMLVTYTYLMWRNPESFQYTKRMWNRKEVRLYHGNREMDVTSFFMQKESVEYEYELALGAEKTLT